MSKLNSKKLKEILSRIDVSSYLSYKEYLSDLFKTFKMENPGFTHKDFSEVLGLSRNNNSIRLVISGHRILTEKTAKTIVQNLGLKLAERRFFMALVDFNNERVPRVREEYFATLVKLKSEISPKALDSKQLRYFEQWYNPILREIMSLKHIDGTPEGIQEALCFPLRLDEIKRSLELLEELGAIQFNKTLGRYEKTSGHISTDSEVDSLSITTYHQKMIEMGKDSITRVHEEARSINAVTVSISREKVAFIKDKINQLLDEVLELEGHCDNPTDVYQLNVQLFPFTRKDRE